MRRRPPVVRRAFVPVALLLITALASCSKSRKAADSTAARTSPAAAPARLAATRGVTVLPGALGKPIGQYSAEEFYTFVHSLAFSGGVEKPRKCRKNPQCDARGGKLTSARVDAVDNQDSLSVLTIPATGVVAVKASNTGQFEEARYGLRPGPYEYYVIVMPGTGTVGKWTLQQLETTAGARKLTEVATGTFQPCNHPFKRQKIRASFYTCQDAHMANDSVMKMGLMLQDTTGGGGSATDPIWTGCALGCCTLR